MSHLFLLIEIEKTCLLTRPKVIWSNVLHSASVNEGTRMTDYFIKGVYCWGKHVDRESVQPSERYSSRYKNYLCTIV
jgi:hypothetical protein